MAGVAVFAENIFTKIPLLNDSKKISEKNREKIFNELKNLEKTGEIQIFHIFKSAEEIDKMGIRGANFSAMGEIIVRFLQKNKKILENKNFFIKIDGADNFVFDEKILENYKIENIFVEKKSRKKSEKFSENEKIQKILRKFLKKKSQKEIFLKFLDFYLFKGKNFKKYEKLDFSYSTIKYLFQGKSDF